MAQVTVYKARLSAKPKTFRASPAKSSQRKPDHALIPANVGGARSQFTTEVQAQEQFIALTLRIKRNRRRMFKAKADGHFDKMRKYEAILEDQLAKLDMLMPAVERYYNG